MCSTFPVLLGLSPSIGKKHGASDMLDGDNVEASSKEPKRAKLTVQASQPNSTLPLLPISILQSHNSEQEHDELEPSKEHLSDNMDDEGDRPDVSIFEQSEEEGEDV